MVPESDELLAEVRGLRELDRVHAHRDVRRLRRHRAPPGRRPSPSRAERSAARGWPCSPCRRCAASRFHTIFFCGLSEGGFPPRPRQDPVLLDEERGPSTRVSVPICPSRASVRTSRSVLFALALEAARARAVLISPRLDGATGRPRLPSRFVLRICDVLAGRPVALGELDAASFLGGVWRRVPGSVGVAGRGCAWRPRGIHHRRTAEPRPGGRA